MSEEIRRTIRSANPDLSERIPIDSLYRIEALYRIPKSIINKQYEHERHAAKRDLRACLKEDGVGNKLDIYI